MDKKQIVEEIEKELDRLMSKLSISDYTNLIEETPILKEFDHKVEESDNIEFSIEFLQEVLELLKTK